MERMSTAEDTYIHKNNNVITCIYNYHALGYLLYSTIAYNALTRQLNAVNGN